MKRKLTAVVIVLGLLIGGNLKNTEQYTKEHPVIYKAEAKEAEPKVVLIEVRYSEEGIIRRIQETFPEDSVTAVKIARCESGLNPNAHNGSNKDGTSDGGLMQINSTHDKKLKELGLDKYNVDDNLKFARILYDESKWNPWVCARKI